MFQDIIGMHCDTCREDVTCKRKQIGLNLWTYKCPKCGEELLEDASAY